MCNLETQETKPKIEAKEDSPGQTLSPINTTTEQTAANYTITEQTQSSSATTPYKGYTNQTPDAQTQSTTTTATADQSTASYQAYTQPQAASTASATEKTALSSSKFWHLLRCMPCLWWQIYSLSKVTIDQRRSEGSQSLLPRLTRVVSQTVG